MEPNVVFKETFMVVGMRVDTRMVENQIPELWQKFLPRMDEIVHRTNHHDTYGISEYSDNYVDEFFTYWACAPVNSIEVVPDGMISKTIQGALYVVVTHKGKLESMGKAFEFIHNTWLPNSGYQLDEKDSFELYGERFLGGENEQSETDIYIAIKASN
ncbi:GyrI-like domain-containing protein [Paenibacillus eucommiae]|uniref:Transcriptional regulator YdeE n=1 Tax=Paenibacillus eucommiae TaxID=1355755 RepID=A0ABS4IWH9_9BACL|nr:GyrI-like domain-containing protein [Paenibacillus eucommiae]MBP1991920.1 putative transcriptional regulator YdeE [Paenibacillus eucommiae]